MFYAGRVMKDIIIKNLKLGSGRPAVCVPITAGTIEELAIQAESVIGSSADMVEWRCDWFTGLFEGPGKEKLIKKAMSMIIDIIGKNMPVLATIRTKAEGGESDISYDDYAYFYRELIKTGSVDIIDIELSMLYKDSVRSRIVSDLIQYAHDHGVRVLLSSHDFKKTPPEDEMLKKLAIMQSEGADIAKIAVMPDSAKDVLALLSASEKCKTFMKIPVVTISMGKPGLISRFSGEIFGSCITFGMCGKGSAPGQIDVDELKYVLDVIHKNC